MNYTVHGILQAKILEWVILPIIPGIFPTQDSNPGLQLCRQILYSLSHQGSPIGTLLFFKPCTSSAAYLGRFCSFWICNTWRWLQLYNQVAIWNTICISSSWLYLFGRGASRSLLFHLCKPHLLLLSFKTWSCTISLPTCTLSPILAKLNSHIMDYKCTNTATPIFR